MKLSSAQQRLLLHLQKRKERERLGMCIVEGEKFVRDVRDFLEFSFTDRDTPLFREIISTDSPQHIAGVARLPSWSLADVFAQRTVLVLDGVQDPGNVGALLRLALGFSAGVILVSSAEVSNPKTVRASAGAVFFAPWVVVDREALPDVLAEVGWPIFRLEMRRDALTPRELPPDPLVLVVGSEGKGITLSVTGSSVVVMHDARLESLNVAVAAGIVLYERYTS